MTQDSPLFPDCPPLLDVLAEFGEQQADGPAGVQPAGLLQGAPQSLGAQHLTEGDSGVHQHHVRDIHLLEQTQPLGICLNIAGAVSQRLQIAS
jgi:hypothetical protein